MMQATARAGSVTKPFSLPRTSETCADRWWTTIYLYKPVSLASDCVYFINLSHGGTVLEDANDAPLGLPCLHVLTLPSNIVFTTPIISLRFLRLFDPLLVLISVG